MKNTFSHQKIFQRKGNEAAGHPSAGRDGMAIASSQNRTGLPDALKSGIESLSGMAMDDVRVHYNSPKPMQLQALAYTQGTDIHVAPGQERHLPHEAWHVVQQAQGRVQPTMQMKGVSINDNGGLEHEADVMGAKARQGQTVMQQKSAHANGCGCASCSGSQHTTRQMVFNPAGQGRTIQRKRCSMCGQSPCICPNNRGPAPTGNYKNTSGHHDGTKAKWRAKKVIKNWTGKNGKKS